MSVVVEETSVQVVAEDALHSVRGVEGLPQFISACTTGKVYADVDAFNAHATGPYFAAFYAEAGA